MRPRHAAQGERIVLDAMDARHVDGPYLGWLRDPEVTRYLEARFTDYDAEALRRYIQTESERPDGVLFGMFLREDRRHIGTLKLSRIRNEHRNCEIGLMVGEKAFWGRGIGAEAITLASGYAFHTLGLHKILAGAYSNNVGSTKAFLKAGYTIEGRLVDDRWDGGQWVDRVLLGKINPAERDLAGCIRRL